MTYRDASRTPPRRNASIVVVGVLVVAASAVALGLTQQVSSSPTAAPPASSSAMAVASPVSSPATNVVPTAVLSGHQRGELGAPADALPRGRGVALGVGDGVLPSRTTIFDDDLPGIAKLDAALLDALQRASTDAQRKGVRLYVDSGWRSRQYQEQLFRQAISEYDSEAEAARWVAIPGTSPHESRNAVDIGPSGAVAWLSKHGAAYGLCQIYRNEPWHYELRPKAIDRGCPRMYAEPTHDPRMQQ